jgi:hypothetical protein
MDDHIVALANSANSLFREGPLTPQLLTTVDDLKSARSTYLVFAAPTLKPRDVRGTLFRPASRDVEGLRYLIFERKGSSWIGTEL